MSDVERKIAEAREKGEAELDLGNVQELPRSLLTLPRLRQLRAVGLSSIPKWIGELVGLDRFEAVAGNVTELPSSIGKLKNLRRLSIAGQGLRSLPDSVAELTWLRILILSHNPLTHVPKAVLALPGLQHLDIENIGASVLPDDIRRLESLHHLSLSHNPLFELPTSITTLSSLETLFARRIGLRALPPELAQISSLKYLVVAENELIELPDFWGAFTRLSYLNVARNELAQLPNSLGLLSKLGHLDASNNRLMALPSSLRSLGALTTLYLRGNEALALPHELLEVGEDDGPIRPRATPAEILDYYFRIRGGKRPLNEAKLILVGRGGMGKTSLVNRLVHDRFDKDERKTEGICITHWPLTLPKDEKIRLNVWDFGGQEIMHATHQFFLTQRSLYLLVLNGREGGEDQDAEYWLRLITSFGGGSPVIVVLNKIHEQSFDLNRRALQQKYPSIREFVRTDCADGTGIAELRRVIERETDQLEHLRDAFPSSWFEIKDRLSGMRENYLSFERYRQICADHGEDDVAAQEALAGYLHSLGIALNYKDDPRLRDKHVLNPHWVTSGIYTLLNARLLAERGGVLHLGDLAEVLDAKAYPPEMHAFLLDLMKRFELCFSFPDDDRRHLVPELLDKQEPEAASRFDAEECLHFRYRYPILPEGLLPRFIVRTHVLSEGLPRWRTGVVLRFEGNEALVKADVQDRTVRIAVSGPREGRRRLLAIIRSDLERIHRSIERLQPEELVPLPDRPEVVISYATLATFEKRGKREIDMAVGDDVVSYDVQDLLNGVDLDGARRQRPAREEEARPIALFYSYAPKDETLRDELETHLKLLQRGGVIDTFHDRRIEVGEDWKSRIDERLDRADVVLLLVSADYLASDYCYESEMKRALTRSDVGQAKVVPVLLRDVSWGRAPFAKHQALPRNGVPVTKWTDRDSAWRDVADGIEQLVEALRRDRRR